MAGVIATLDHTSLNCDGTGFGDSFANLAAERKFVIAQPRSS
jgi:hypothetical protein